MGPLGGVVWSPDGKQIAFEVGFKRKYCRPCRAVAILTLEDETGNSNIVVWADLVKRYRAQVLHARLLRVKGVIEKEGDVIHIIAGHLEDITPLLGDLDTHSRDFH